MGTSLLATMLQCVKWCPVHSWPSIKSYEWMNEWIPAEWTTWAQPQKCGRTWFFQETESGWVWPEWNVCVWGTKSFPFPSRRHLEGCSKPHASISLPPTFFALLLVLFCLRPSTTNKLPDQRTWLSSCLIPGHDLPLMTAPSLLKHYFPLIIISQHLVVLSSLWMPPLNPFCRLILSYSPIQNAPF